MKKAIVTQNAPKAIGPYSAATIVADTVYVSGQLGLDPKTGELKEDITAQTRQSLENIKAILEAEGMNMNSVVKTTVLLSDIKNFAAMNEEYATYFTEPYPARAAFEVAALPKGGLVEIEAIAVKD